jgi:DtxR family Mn-dependent transcriptional regulator
MQKDELVMAALRRVGALPDKVVTVAAGAGGVLVGSGGETAEIDLDLASHLFVHRL